MRDLGWDCASDGRERRCGEVGLWAEEVVGMTVGWETVFDSRDSHMMALRWCEGEEVAEGGSQRQWEPWRCYLWKKSGTHGRWERRT